MSRYELISDEALIEAVQRGDGDAAAHLYHRHIDRVHRICYRIVLDHSQVQDCVQEVWLKVFRNLGRFRCQRSFAAWLNSVTANTAIDYYRRSRRRSGHVDLDDPRTESLEIEPHADDRQLDDATIRRRIQDALVPFIRPATILSNAVQGKIGKPIIIGYNRQAYGTRKMGALVVLPEAETPAPAAPEPKTR